MFKGPMTKWPVQKPTETFSVCDKCLNIDRASTSKTSVNPNGVVIIY